MKRLRSLLIDDEPNARMRLRRLLKDEQHVEVIGEAKDGLEAVTEIQRLKPDLVFLDVQMPGLDGFETLKALPSELPVPLIIFVTGFHEHAMAAFDANAIAYLLKPIEPERLREMVERAWRLQHFAEDRAQAANEVHQFTASVPPNFARSWLVSWIVSYCSTRPRSSISIWTTVSSERVPATTMSGLTINWAIWNRD